MDITISPAACPDDTYRWWDTIWDPDAQCGDWALAAADEVSNRGGLQAKAAIATAVILALFTDKACPPDHPLFKYADGDPRGWWGDGAPIDDDDEPMGSLLWLLERSVAAGNLASQNAAQWAESFATAALATLIKQGVAVSCAAAATLYPQQRGMTLAVTLIGSNGSIIYSGKFEVLWSQVN